LRLTDFERELIKKAFYATFQDGKIYLFGSRVDDTKRGGDIDLFIKLPYSLNADEIFDKKSEFRLKLHNLIGEQKIDIVFAKSEPTSIEKTALDRLEKIFYECAKHLERMNSASKKMANFMPIDEQKYIALTEDEIEHIDQFLFRFSKLQDRMGQKLFKAMLVFL